MADGRIAMADGRIAMADGRDARAWISFARHVHGRLAQTGDFARDCPPSTI
uniref:Uncharacterized protein n=1 Tax=Desulfovibrio sp. U5L TaxID=596152 RepID=I2Q6Q8_9BACT